MSRQAELVSRWDGFLAKIKARFDELLTQGQAAVLASLDENDFDYGGSTRTLMAIESQIRDSLLSKIDDTWRDQVEPAMRADGDYWLDEIRKGPALNDELHRELTLWHLVTEGLLSKKYYDHAITLINRDFYCSQCRSPLQIQKDFFRSQYVTCAYCNTVNTFEPETKYVMISWNVVNSMAKLSALDEYRKVLELQHKRVRREAHDLYMLEYKSAYKKYLEKYFTERGKLLPETAATYAADIEAEMNKNFNPGV